MESGEAAETWLDTQLIADDRWDDGLADDVAPWLATAFADLAVMSIDDVTAAADAAAMADSVVQPTPPSVDDDTDVDDDATTVADELALDGWLGSHADFQAVDDSVSFAVLETERVDAGDASADDALDAFDADAAASLAAMASASLAVPPGLTDPFDQPVRQSTGIDTGPDAGAATDLDDDIVATPAFDDAGAEPAPSDDDARAEWVEAPQPGIAVDSDDLAEQSDTLTDGSLVVDPFDELGMESAGGDEFAEAVGDEAPHPGPVDVDADGWGDV